MLGDMLEHVMQIRLWVQVIALRGSQQAINGCGTLATIVGTGKQPVPALMNGHA